MICWLGLLLRNQKTNHILWTWGKNKRFEKKTVVLIKVALERQKAKRKKEKVGLNLGEPMFIPKGHSLSHLCKAKCPQKTVKYSPL